MDSTYTRIRTKARIAAVIPVPRVLVLIYIVGYAVAGAAIGAALGFLCSLLFSVSKRGILIDAVLGAIGLVGGIIGCALLPWPQNTVTYLIGGTTVSSTMDQYQHPEAVGLALSVLFPLLYETFRVRHFHTKRIRPT